MSWLWYEIGRTDGYASGRHDAERSRIIVDHRAVYQTQAELDQALALIAAYRTAVAAHPDRARIEQHVSAIAPRRYVCRRIFGLVGTLIKAAGWVIALGLIGSVLFR